VLDVAVATASVDGLDGMSLGHLADQLGVSKSGLFAHWRDKQQLQLDVINHAVQQWRQQIVIPAQRRPAGLPRLWALHVRRLRFYREEVLPGRCFFAAVNAEYDDRPGPVQDAIRVAIRRWTDFLAAQVREAVKLGQLPASVDPDQLAFEIEAMGMAAALRADPDDPARPRRYARRAVLRRLRALALDPSLLPEE
jgi:AcrR family transcriptional regulator